MGRYLMDGQSSKHESQADKLVAEFEARTPYAHASNLLVITFFPCVNSLLGELQQEPGQIDATRYIPTPQGNTLEMFITPSGGTKL